MFKINFIVTVGIFLIQSLAYAIPSNFRIRLDGTNITVTEYETRKTVRAYQIKEALNVKKLESELAARAVVLGTQIQSVNPHYYLPLANHIFRFIGQVKQEYNLDFSKTDVKDVSEKHFLNSGEQAYLLLLVEKASKANTKETHKIISKFFDELEYVLDTDTISQYLSIDPQE
ncbi:MAG: hypothetical protein A2381_11470 [Bdellovibrionales bacterium RIFOXYB1_FULL_37_110]|nr:MAG: hypothetical protein A2417_11775 [Bdellovibrionales bacterium RIFOXYC1_FULL_37_79]OFZ57312.1 MAG: hypothetical protein A2381_11470 [Bdellovibrionales bacterium RIFOXYB1_FULL_37_110]OFZ62208.1 MAG: hypothetical protein A2577_14020 [Bdellovibrionales bacterium RIFOXYD1_FULL_36_51]